MYYRLFVIFLLSKLWVFISFSCLAAWARTTSTMLIKNVRANILALFPNLGENIHFSPLLIFLSIIFLYTLYQVEKNPSIPFISEDFSHECELNFSSVFLHKLSWFYGFSILACRFCGLLWLSNIEPALHARNRSHFVIIKILIVCCWILFANILLKIFIIYILEG